MIFKAGEILVCAAIDPNMPCCAVSNCDGRMQGVIMIHNAIIARECDIPCVTGIPLATLRISKGDNVTVDDFLGILTLDKKL